MTGPQDVEVETMAAAKLSLCMIVKNEEAMLPDFLAAVEGLWDELIVADTGSDDATVAMLEAAGALIVHHAWRGDFAAARNASLEPATGDWILFLDADERVTADLHAEIRALLEDPLAGAATVIMRNALPGGHHRETPLLRLFRRDGGIRFTHRIHEDVTTAVGGYLRRQGLVLRPLRGVVEHLGYVRDVAADRDKKTRDLTILQEMVAADPGDLYSWFKILEQARFWNDRELWRTAAQEAAVHLTAADAAVTGHLHFGAELAASIAGGLPLPPDQALAWLDTQSGRVSPTPAWHLQRGLLAEKAGDSDCAGRAYQACLGDDAATADQMRQVRPLLGLCRLAAAAGDLDRAHDLALRAATAGPRDPEALLAALTFTELVSGPSARDALTGDLARQAGDGLELAQALGTLAVERGDHGDAIGRLEPAVGDPPSGPAALTLAQAYLGDGRLAEATDLLNRLVAEQPEAGLGLLTCALVEDVDIDLSLDLDPETAEEQFQRWIHVLWNSRQTELMSTFAETCGSVVEIFPWLPDFLQKETRRLKGDGA